MALTQFGVSIPDPKALEALAGYLQRDTEERSRVLAHELHDDLGGSLIAAMMDVAWLTGHSSAAGAEVSLRLHRTHGSLTRAVETLRRLVDELRPALIDSLGLFVAMSAHFGRECRRYGVNYSDKVVGAAPDIDTASAMSVFRIAQGFLQWFREDTGAKELDVRFEGDTERLVLHFVARGLYADARCGDDIVAPRLASIALRVRNLNGTLRSEASKDGVTIQVQIPAHASQPPLTG
jgi:signal transduction histidine kinase